VAKPLKESASFTFAQWAKANPDQAVRVPAQGMYELAKSPNESCCGCVCGRHGVGCEKPLGMCSNACVDDMVRRRYRAVVERG
jgi:hypothetical protein